ncbi:hypothetical protein GCG21_00495 [Pseudactinotalea sp. HY160]|nr:hypothetical protein [Pseudactinotalea sp. HY160]
MNARVARRHGPSRGRGARGVVALVALAATLAACTSSTDDGASPSPAGESSSAPEPGAEASTSGTAVPSVSTTGPRSDPARSTGPVATDRAGQTIEGTTITGRLTISHDDVTVRDVTVRGTGTYMIYVQEKSGGGCPENVRLEYVEVDGSGAPADSIPIYSPECGFTLDHGLVHHVGRGIRIANDVVVENSYIFLTRTWEGAHRSGVSTHGGEHIVLRNNVIICENVGCSAAITMYGDHAPVDGVLVEHNVIASTGSYCAYGGSVESKSFPDGADVRFIDNRFSTRYFPTCGRYGPVAGFAAGSRGNEWRGNVWQETGEPIREPAS